ncbi:MAG: hypothetical protein AAGJ18_13030 [Bacteroidota bacterium]
MGFNGNSHTNEKPHHLYIIFDKETGDIDKYGISADPIEEDGLSARIKTQLELFNRIARWHRFYAIVLHQNIDGRVAARALEKQYIDNYLAFYGYRPPGNKIS